MDLLNCPAFFSISLFFFLLVVVGRTANGITNLADVSCGKQLSRRPKVVGGNDAYEGEFPWVVSIKEKTSETQFTHVCGGSILNKRYVLSAAHCFEKFQHSRRAVGLDRLRVTVGEHDLTQDESSLNAAVSVGVERLTVNPDYDIFGCMNDIALLRLDREIQWTPNSWPACLPDQDYEVVIQQNATVVGWGSKVDITGDETPEFPSILQKANVPLLSNSDCKEWFHQSGVQWTPKETHLCAGYAAGGVDACRGDSGGPLMVQSQNDDFAIVGVVAAGKGCARAHLPGFAGECDVRHRPHARMMVEMVANLVQDTETLSTLRKLYDIMKFRFTQSSSNEERVFEIGLTSNLSTERIPRSSRGLEYIRLEIIEQLNLSPGACDIPTHNSRHVAFVF